MTRSSLVKFAIICSVFLLTTNYPSAQAQAGTNIKDGLENGSWLQLVQKYPSEYFEKEFLLQPQEKILANWWLLFEDEQLSQLIRWSFASNKDLQSARAKVQEARANLGISQAKLLPWLDNTDSWTRSKTPDNTTAIAGTAGVYRLALDASWEFDIFGSQRQTSKAAFASWQAENALLQATWVSLSAEIALNYFSFLTLEKRLEIAQNNLELQENTWELLNYNYEAGLIDALPLEQAKYTVEQTRATIPPLKESKEQTLNNLAILTGQVPGSLTRFLNLGKGLPNLELAKLNGIPADTLRQRPDILAAELALKAQIARKKAAKADRWPKFHLFGSIGVESVDSGSLFTSGSKAFTFGPSITIPLFHAGAIRKNIKVQTARQEQYLAAYEKSILQAVAEVRNALAANILEMKRYAALQDGVQAAEIALQVAQDRYTYGLTDFQNVIDAQRTLLALADQQAISQGQKAANLVSLFKSLGGGWEPFTKEQPKVEINKEES